MKRQTKRLAQIIAGTLLLFAGAKFETHNIWITFGIYFAAYVISGGDILLSAARNIINGQVFNEDFLMSIATIGAFAIGEYPEGIAVMLFYKVGALFQSYAVDKSRKSISALMGLRPEYANVVRGEEIDKVDPNDVRAGEMIMILPGEKIPLDGVVVDGSSSLDCSSLTGESIPQEIFPGSLVLSGCININGLLTVNVTKEYGESTVSKILDLVENAMDKKAKSESFITKFARYYTPFVVFLASLISVLPPLLLPGEMLYDWVYRGLTFLVISCPCALVVSVPMSFFGGIGGASRKGILIKGSNYLEALSQVDTIVFDKTGTLTKGVFSVQRIHSENLSENLLLEIAAHAESYSNHPISASLQKAYGNDINFGRVESIEEFAGHGVNAVVDGKRVSVGNDKLMDRMNVEYTPSEYAGTVAYVAINDVFEGYIVISDEIKDDSKEAMRLLKEDKIKKTIMLTGDGKSIGEQVGRELGIDLVYSQLLPADKVDRFDELLKLQAEKKKIAYVGDGINDAPVLAKADVGIAMGAFGSDAAIEAADVVIMSDEPSKISMGIKIAKKTLGIVKQNIVFTLVVKFSVLVLAALGMASMWAGVMADVGVTVLAVMNALRALVYRPSNN